VSQLRYLLDENCNARIFRGLLRRAPQLNILTIHEAGLRGDLDAAILEFAAMEQRVVVSHDVRTMPVHAKARLLATKPMSGLILISQDYPVGQAIDDLVLIAEVSTVEEWQGKIIFLPL
jgi:predicted nuclease of predicted toxin-antitoxin system